MKRINKFLTGSAVAMASALLMTSCAMDAPFGDGGEGTLTITTDIRGDVKKVSTRAIADDELTDLQNRCVVYIENSKGVIRKYKGVQNIPEQIKLRTGHYLAEAWSGDSVSASFDSKFYRGKQEFDINEGNQSLTLRCNIANVIASVDPESLNAGLSNMKVTFSHSRGELQFDESNFSSKGYFMMPNADKDLSWKVEGTKSDGTPFTKEGKIEGVQRAHEYSMLLTTEDRPITEGGALIRITIVDIPVIDEEVEVFTGPAISGIGYNIGDQVVSTDKSFTDTKVYLRAFFGMSSIVLDFSQNFGIESGKDIVSDHEYRSALEAKGILIETVESKDAAPTQEGGEVKVEEYYITFPKAFLDGLAPSDDEYTVKFTATDARHITTEGALHIANSNNAILVPPTVGTVAAPDSQAAPMAILATSAEITGQLFDATATGFGIQYRESGTADWLEAFPTSGASAKARRDLRGVTRADNEGTPYTVKLSGLKAGTTYEYRSFCGESFGKTMTFTTESVYKIPNASMEDWSTTKVSTLFGTKDCVFPGTGSSVSYWDSGNAGAATANKTLTNKSTDMVHSGTYSVRLSSQSAVGVLAAGNVFIGQYVETDGTNGVLKLGRDYNGSHPTKLRVWINYRPGTVDIIKDDNAEFLEGMVKGNNDRGQIYVALTSEMVDIRTNPKKRKLFDKEDACVLGYGQVTLDANYGPDGQLQSIEIPIDYKESAKTIPAKYLVLTVAASKFGDYFSGSSSTVMYLDDFELVY